MPRVGVGALQHPSGWHRVWWRCAVLGGVLPLATLEAGPVHTQVTYMVFPAVSANVSQPTQPAPRVTLRIQDSTIAYTVRTLVHQAHMRLLYDIDNPAFAKRVSVDVTNTDVLDALTTVLKGTGLVAKVAPDGETVVVRGASDVAEGRKRQQGGTIAGRVTDSTSGAGLKGAQVRVEGTKLVVTSADSGNFLLRNVPPGDQVLRVRLFGYRPAGRTVTVVDGERTTVRIAMAPVPTVLSGIVTTATGLQRKVEVGNDITSLNVDSITQVAPISSVTDLLETRVPGLTVLHSSGVPGAPSRLRLRGVGSPYLDNDPIIIIDGVRVYANQSDSRNANLAQSGLSLGTAQQVGIDESSGGRIYSAPSPLDQIDPNDIETVEVFKGPSASALYGSDAASGVIVITTKHGRAGPTHWTLSLGQGVSWLPGTWPIHYFRFGQNDLNGGPLCAWSDPSCTVDSVVPFQALNDPRFTVLSHGQDQTANLTVSGGVPTLQYSLTGSGTGDLGMLKLPAASQQLYETLNGGPIPHDLKRPDNYQTWGVGGSLTAQPSPVTRVTLTSSLFNSHQQQGSLQQALPQLEGVYLERGFIDPTQPNNPQLPSGVERATSGQLTSTNALSVSWQPYVWLPLTATGGLNTIQRTDETYIPFGVCSGVNSGNQCFGDTTGSYGLGRGLSHNQTLTVGTTIPLFWNRMSLAVGGNLYQQSTADFQAYTDQLAPGVSQPTSFNCPSNDNRCSSGQATSTALTYGWYVEPRLNFHSRFFVAPGFRLDGGSGGSRVSYSGSGLSPNGLSAFPKVDFSWIAVDRQGERPLWGLLTLLRPRVAFGYAGTQPLPQDKLRLYNTGQYQQSVPGTNGLVVVTGISDVCNAGLTLDGGASYVPPVCLNSLGNTQLRPERSSELEGGFDATLWRGRLTLTYTQYDKTRHDAILAIPVAPSVAVLSTGIDQTQYEKNVGVIRNTGTEVTVNAFVLQSRAMSWNVGANLSNDNNMVVRLNPGQAPICFGSISNGVCTGTRIVAGFPLFGLWEQPIASFADVNHDGIIEPTEIRLADSSVYVGQPNPKYQVNLNTGLTLFDGRLSVNATFAYQNGLTQTNQGALTSGGFALVPNAPNTPLAVQAAVAAATELNPGTLIGVTQTVNTFRFNDLSINYQVPQVLSSLLHVPRATLALQGSNLALRTNYHGKDPAVNAFSTVSAGDETLDLGQLPEPRTWWLKVNLGN